ncbi:hypothetical protein MN608_11652 [Microdochium nivale]|nr:hypothetical protein MN608_11652 [Microdochium nivale]
MKFSSTQVTSWLAALAITSVSAKPCGSGPSLSLCTTSTTVTETSTSQEVSSITQEPLTTLATQIETSTVTVTSSGTATFSTTSTLFETTTATTISTNTVTVTQTSRTTKTVGPLVTISASPGFIPIRSEYPENGPSPVTKRALDRKDTQHDQHIGPICSSTTTITATSSIVFTETITNMKPDHHSGRNLTGKFKFLVGRSGPAGVVRPRRS